MLGSQIKQREELKTGSQSKQQQLTQAQMMQKKFEFENEVIEEELYQFSEAETDRLFRERPW
jgi:hypothetical protein